MTETIMAEPDSRLEALLAQYDLAKAESKKAEDALKAIVDGIKNEIASVLPEGETRAVVDSPDLIAPLRLVHTRPWRLDETRLKAEDPLTYVRYAKQGDQWTLSRVTRGAS